MEKLNIKTYDVTGKPINLNEFVYIVCNEWAGNFSGIGILRDVSIIVSHEIKNAYYNKNHSGFNFYYADVHITIDKLCYDIKNKSFIMKKNNKLKIGSFNVKQEKSTGYYLIGDYYNKYKDGIKIKLFKPASTVVDAIIDMDNKGFNLDELSNDIFEYTDFENYDDVVILKGQ